MSFKPPCEIAVRFTLPAIRLLIAKKLVEKYNFTQTSAAKALGTTQPAISYYIQSKRGWRLSEKLMKIDEVKLFVEEAAERIATSKSLGINMVDICQLCKSIQKYMDEFKTL